MAGPQFYNLNLVNESEADWTFYVYQTTPDLAKEDFFSLAWLVSPKMQVGDHINFKWSIDYQFMWSEVGTLSSGIVFEVGGQKPCNPTGHNTTHFTVHGESANLSEPVKAYEGGTLYIKNDPNVPWKTYSEGIGMNNAPAIVTYAEPNVLQEFTSTPTYWVAAANVIKAGTVLDIQTVTTTKKVVFGDDVFEKTATLTKENEWKLSEHQADAMTADANSVGSIAATTPNERTTVTNNYNICALI